MAAGSIVEKGKCWNKKKMERHISLMESERTGILWKSEKVGQKNLNRLFIARKNSVTVDLSFFGEKL